MDHDMEVQTDHDTFLTLFGQKNPWFWIFPWIPLLTHTRRHIGEDFRKFSAKTNDENWNYQSKTFKKLDFWQNGHFLRVFGQKIPNFEFFHGNHHSHTLLDTKEKTLGSFQPKLMTKVEVISQKLLKNWSFCKNGHFLTLFG